MSTRLALLIVPLALALPASLALGQAALPSGMAPATSTAPAEGAKGTLGPEYVDGSFGFGIRPLAGAVIYREKRRVEGDLQVCQFAHPGHRWSLSVRVANSPRPIGPMDLLANTADEMAIQYPDVKVVRREAAQIAAREAGRLALTFTAQQEPWYREQAAVRVQPSQYLVVVLVAPLGDRQAAEATFGHIVAEFRSLRTAAVQQQLDEALVSGTTLLRRAASGQPDITAKIVPESYFLIRRDGRELGVAENHEQLGNMENLPGLHMIQRAWLFEDDGTVVFLEENRFLSRDLSYEQWENVRSTLTTALDAAQKPIPPEISFETGLRRDDKLLISSTPRLGHIEPTQKVLETESSYASGSWSLLLPRLVDLDKPELYAFSTWDADREGMILRVHRVAGPIPGSLTRIEDSEGLVPPINQVDVDATGKVVRVQAGPFEMLGTPKAQLDVRWAERIKATQARFRQFAAKPRPQPGTPGGAGKPTPPQPRPPRSRR